jgi:hypothetical protein
MTGERTENNHWAQESIDWLPADGRYVDLGRGLYVRKKLGKDGEVYGHYIVRYTLGERVVSKSTGRPRSRVRSHGLGSIRKTTFVQARARGDESLEMAWRGVDPAERHRCDRNKRNAHRLIPEVLVEVLGKRPDAHLSRKSISWHLRIACYLREWGKFRYVDEIANVESMYSLLESSPWSGSGQIKLELLAHKLIEHVGLPVPKNINTPKIEKSNRMTRDRRAYRSACVEVMEEIPEDVSLAETLRKRRRTKMEVAKAKRESNKAKEEARKQKEAARKKAA